MGAAARDEAGLAVLTGGIGNVVKHTVVNPQKRIARETKEAGERQQLAAQAAAQRQEQLLREKPKKLEGIGAQDDRKRRLTSLRRGLLANIRTSSGGLIGAPSLSTPALAAGMNTTLGA